ncbi:DNA mismatch repair protein MutS [soil metagenome]
MNDATPLAESAGSVKSTPMMEQYLAIKAANPGCLLFYRMGDFYELFFEDAETASRILGIALTKRGKHQGADIAMCGVPIHASDQYLERLIRSGQRVAICEQLEDPAVAKARGYKAVVRRDVVRLVTPGTLTEDSLLDSRRNNFIAALAQVKSEEMLALAFCDISSGELGVMPVKPGRLAADLAGLAPGEIIVADGACDDIHRAVLDDAGPPVTPLPASRFDSAEGEKRLKDYFGVKALEGFGSFTRAELSALGGLLDYVLVTQVGRAPSFRPPRRDVADHAVIIDAATRANLELTRTIGGSTKGSLLDAIDRTVTSAGARLLARRLSSPITDPAGINARLDAVSYFAAARDNRDATRAALQTIPDFERALSRLSLGRGGARDLASIRDGLTAAAQLPGLARAKNELAAVPADLLSALAILDAIPLELASVLRDMLADSLPLLARDGGFVRAGYSALLDEQRTLRDETRQVVAGLQAKYAEIAGLRGLKIRHNNVLGYFIEVSAQHAPTLQAAPHNATFFHRQTIANAVRFTTQELGGLEERIAAAASRALAIELDIFERTLKSVLAEAPRISAAALAMAEVDVAAALADLAERARYVRPRVDASDAFCIRQGRHPVVERALAAEGQVFVGNDCDLRSDKRLWLLTGPNMGGKSTFLRQNALIIILAQMGSFVPAAEAHIGVVDRLFSRVGAADDLARGRSTFMVEMVETAAILNQAGEKSFVILDEIGRGTATYDGLAIAWAAVEHLSTVNRARALFATHYHELTALAGRLAGVANATVKVREWQGDVVFLHEVVPGVADRSYGIQVARLAGLPHTVIARASEVLTLLEQSEKSGRGDGLLADLPLFAAARPRSAMAQSRSENAVEARLATIRPDELTPREALDLLYALKAAAGGDKP